VSGFPCGEDVPLEIAYELGLGLRGGEVEAETAYEGGGVEERDGVGEGLNVQYFLFLRSCFAFFTIELFTELGVPMGHRYREGKPLGGVAHSLTDSSQ
jgi:hypothetical protein